MAFIIAPAMSQKSFYDFTVQTIDGEEFSMADLKGKKVMVVNTASKCGYTPQYKDLELLHKAYNKNLVIIGFPANNFREQEPGTNEEIKEFCDSKYGVTFPMMAKISVKGDDMHPLYQWLAAEAPGLLGSKAIKWNFTKFLVGKDGQVTLFEGEQTLDLLQLADFSELFAVSDQVPPGTYSKIRLQVSDLVLRDTDRDEDDNIVIIENIYRYRMKGAPMSVSAQRGAGEMMAPSLLSA